MTYLVQSVLSSNAALNQRIAQCAAEQGVDNPDDWTFNNRRKWASASGWDDAWASALEKNLNEKNYDPGYDETVITDDMILSQVLKMIFGDSKELTP